MTLLFDMWQAEAAAQFGAFLISPFVGRITDWHKANNGWDSLPDPEEDPGVQSVRDIYNHYKAKGYKTIVMGASFRSSGQVLALAGCDKLTIGPKWLDEMQKTKATVERKLSPENKKEIPGLTLTEQNYRWGMNQNAMAVEKLANGIRRFAADTIKLEKIVQDTLSSELKKDQSLKHLRK